MENENTTYANLDIRLDGVRTTVKQRILDMNSMMSEKMQKVVDQKLTEEYVSNLIEKKVTEEFEEQVEIAVDRALNRIAVEAGKEIVDNIQSFGIYTEMINKAEEAVIERLKGRSEDKEKKSI